MNYIYPLIAVLLWGTNTVVTKLCAGHIAPIEIGFYRWVVAVIVLTPFAAKGIVAHWKNVKTFAPKIATLGVLGGVIFQCVAYYAANYTTATKMGIVQGLYPLLAIILAIIFLGFRATVGTVVGSAISLSGVLLVVSGGNINALISEGINRGDTMMLLAVLAFTLYNFLLHKWQIQLPLLQSVFLQALVAMVVLLPIYLWVPHSTLTWELGGYIAFAGVASSILAPLVWITGLRILGSTRVAPFFNLTPIVTTALAVWVLGETITVAIAIGGALAILGVIVSEYWREKDVIIKNENPVV